MKYVWPDGLYIKAGGFINRLRRDMVLVAKPQKPKIRIENHLWYGVDSIKMASGINYKINPLDRDELVRSCKNLTKGKEQINVDDSKIGGLLEKIKSITGIEIPTRNTKDPENTLRFYEDPNGAGYYELDVAGFSERTSIIIPKKREDGACPSLD